MLYSRVCSNALTIFESERSKLAQKHFLLNFTVTNLQVDGNKLVFQYKEPFNAIKEMVESKNWRRGRDSNPRYR